MGTRAEPPNAGALKANLVVLEVNLADLGRRLYY